MASMSAREVAERIKAQGPRFVHRHGVVVSVQAGHTCTITMPGSAVEIAGVRYTAACCPRPGARVILETCGSDLYCIDTIAPVGPAFASVRRIADQNITTANTTQFAFGTSPATTDAWGMIVNSTLVVKVAGVYVVSFAWAFEAHATGYRGVGIAKNGTIIGHDRRSSIGSGNPTYGTTVTTDDFAVGDAISVEVIHTAGVALQLQGGAVDKSRLMATYLGPA